MPYSRLFFTLPLLRCDELRAADEEGAADLITAEAVKQADGNAAADLEECSKLARSTTGAAKVRSCPRALGRCCNHCG